MSPTPLRVAERQLKSKGQSRTKIMVITVTVQYNTLVTMFDVCYAFSYCFVVELDFRDSIVFILLVLRVYIQKTCLWRE